MTTPPRARAAQLPVEDDFYAQASQEGDGGYEGQDGYDGGGSGPGAAQDDAPLYADEAQETGDEENLGADDGDDFFDVTPPSRGQHRQQTLANENARLRREIDEMRGRQAAPAPQPPPGQRPETDEEFEARIQLLGFEEKMEARYKRDRALQQAQNHETRVAAAIMADRTAFEARAREDKRVARWQGRVEAEFTRRQQQGQLVSRFDILKWMIGNRIVDGDEEPVRRERQNAQRRVERQTTRPSSGGSDVRPQRRGAESPAQARARRLAGVQI